MKYLVIFLLIVCLAGCVTPPIVTVDKIVMLELFVAPACSRCPEAKEAAEQLQAEFGGDLIVLEAYAFNYPLSGWSKQEIAARLSNYSSSVSCPDAYFDGLGYVLHYNPLDLDYYTKYKNAVNVELSKETKWTIEATADISSIIRIEGYVKGEGIAQVGACIVEDNVPLYSGIADCVVRDYLDPITIDNEGDFVLTAYLSDLSLIQNMNNIRIVVFVEKNYQILQCKEIM